MRVWLPKNHPAEEPQQPAHVDKDIKANTNNLPNSSSINRAKPCKNKPGSDDNHGGDKR